MKGRQEAARYNITIGEFRVPHSKATESKENCPEFIIASNRRIVAHYDSG